MYLLSIRCIYECKWIKRSLMSISYHLQMVERLTNDTLFQNHHQFFFPSSRTSRFYERPSLQWHHLLLSRRIPATVGIPGLSLHTLCSKSNPDGICSVAAGTSSAYFDNSAQERVQPGSNFIPFPCLPPFHQTVRRANIFNLSLFSIVRSRTRSVRVTFRPLLQPILSQSARRPRHLTVQQQPSLHNIIRSRTSSARVTFRPLLHTVLYQSARRPRYQTIRRQTSLFNIILLRTSRVRVTFRPLLHPTPYQSPRRPRCQTVGRQPSI